MSKLTITVEVDMRGYNLAQGVKEQIAMELEKFGDVRVVSVKESGAPEYRQEVLRG